jgi:hypothetical protein
VKEGPPPRVLLEGRPGIGKSTLARGWSLGCGRRGAGRRVHHGRAADRRAL